MRLPRLFSVEVKFIRIFHSSIQPMEKNEALLAERLESGWRIASANFNPGHHWELILRRRVWFWQRRRRGASH